MDTQPNPPALTDIDLIVVDAFSLLFRAFHSFPPTLTSPDGQLTNAVYGFTRMLLALLEQVKPEYVVVATDMGKPTIRSQQFEAYKANREEAPQELKSQIPLMWQVVESLNIPMLGLEGYEADDIIGTIATEMDGGHSSLIVGILTGDRDMFQLIHDSIYVLYPSRDGTGELTLMDREASQRKIGVWPEQVIDYKALCGDASDNIPGVKGIGPKTAITLLEKYQNLETVYAQLEAGTLEAKPNVINKLTEGKDSAFLSQKIATIDTKAPFEFKLEQAKLNDYEKQKTLELFDSLGFSSLKKKLPVDTFENSVQASLFG